MVSLATLSARFTDFAATSATRAPLYRQLAESIADDADVMRLLQAAPDEQAIPVLLFAAVHHRLLADRSAPLARHFPNLTSHPDSGDPYPTFRDFALDHADELRRTIGTRQTQTNEVGRCALFLPALSLLEHEMGPLAMIDVGASAGLNLLLHRYRYEYAPGGVVGPASSVLLPCSTRGAVPVPQSLPHPTTSVGLDANPIDLDDDDALRWLEACVWPDQIDRFERLVAAIDIARAERPVVHRGDAVDDLAPLVIEAAATGHATVTNSWVLNYLTAHARRRYVAVLDELGQQFDLSWVLAESPAETDGLPVPTTEPAEKLTVLSMVRWRGGQREVQRLATCHPHGYWLHWEHPAN